MNTRTPLRSLRFFTFTLASCALLLSLWGGRVLAQDRDRDRDRTMDPSPAQPEAGLRAQFRTGIDQAPGLSAEQRTRMRENLDACLGLDMAVAEVGALFPEQDGSCYPSAAAMLRFQEQVLDLAEGGLLTEPLVAKIQEGRIKNVPEPALMQACIRVEAQVRSAYSLMNQAREYGLGRPADAGRERWMEGEVAQQMWRGMTREGFEHLSEQARLRLREGPCTIEDLVSASDAATRFEESGVGLGESVQVCGEALRQGYRGQELRELGYMAMATHRRGAPMDEFMNGLEECLHRQMAMGDMYQYMMQRGWMGPGDMQGPGGHSGADDRWGPGHMGNQDGDGGQGGMGGGSGSGNDGHRGMGS